MHKSHHLVHLSSCAQVSQSVGGIAPVASGTIRFSLTGLSGRCRQQDRSLLIDVLLGNSQVGGLYAQKKGEQSPTSWITVRGN